MFAWDPRKAKSNATTHGITFEEAATAFLAPAGLDGEDLGRSDVESRRLRLAKSSLGRVSDRLHHKEQGQSRADEDHQCATREPERKKELREPRKLTFPIFRSYRTSSSRACAESAVRR